MPTSSFVTSTAPVPVSTWLVLSRLSKNEAALRLTSRTSHGAIDLDGISQLQVRQCGPAGLTLEMGGGPLVEALPDEGLAKEQLNVLFRPVLGGQALQEHHDFLEIHLDELVGPLDKQRGADVEMKLGKALLFGLCFHAVSSSPLRVWVGRLTR